jgi:membrane-associated protease RseP (regulator of RpoE activity)
MPRRWWVHASLFALTALTTAYAPHLWELRWEEVEGLGDLFRPEPVYSFWVLLILGCHEMGHYLACRYYGIPATLPFFVPGLPPIGTFGAVIRIRGPIPSRRALFDVAAAGPLAGFAVALPVFLVGLLGAKPLSAPVGDQALGQPVLSFLLTRWLLPVDVVALEVGFPFLAGWVGMLVTSLNLFPVGQLDGGHLMYAVSRRSHRIASRITLVALLGVVVVQAWLFLVPAYVVWFLILLWMRDRHPRLVDESEPLGPGRLAVACLLLLIFLASFIPMPLSVG